MCGIVGVVNSTQKENNLSTINKMMELIKHRGPDDSGRFINKNKDVAFGHVRLSIIDIKGGHQPFISNDENFTIVFNGEIYNYIELREELLLKGYTFHSKSDTEVLLNGFIEYKEKVLTKLNGMFSFAIYDKNEDQLFIARDRLGVKPLYYTYSEEDKSLYFASELKAISESIKIDKTINPIALISFLRKGFVIPPLTIFTSIKKLSPAHYMIIDKNRNLTITKYWDIDITKMTFSKEKMRADIKDLLFDATKLRLRTDVKFGTLLSGGVDSTLVTSIAKRIDHNPIETFSSSFNIGERSFKYNQDAELAKKTAQSLKTIHHDFKVVNDESFFSEVKKSVYHMDEPHFAATNLTIMLLTKYIKDGSVKVVLDGSGSDEIFAGYDKYRYDKIISILKLIPDDIRNILFSHNKFKSIQLKTTPKNFSFERLFTWWGTFTLDELKEILNIDVKITNNQFEQIYMSVTTDKNFDSNEDMLQYMDIKYWLGESELMSMDKMSMANGIEIRSPFLDYRVVEYAMKIPFKHKINIFSQAGGKKILKDSFGQNLLPNEIKNRKKTGWFSPVHYWVKDFLWNEIVTTINKLPETGLFNANVLQYTTTYEAKNTQKIWNLFMFGLWYEIYIGYNNEK